jgi:hypothetical protein
VRVTVISTVRSTPPMVADELRRQADNFLELQDLANSIQRSHSNRYQQSPLTHEHSGTDDHAVQPDHHPEQSE